MTSQWRCAGSVLGVLFAVATLLGCAAPAPIVAPPKAVSGPVVSFSLVAADGTAVSTETIRGRVTLVALVTTYDWASQLLLRRVNQALGSFAPRINALGVVLEAADYSVLLTTFSGSLNLHFPLAMADQATLEGSGPFAPIDYVPTLLVLDPRGRLVARLQGPVERAEIDTALKRAQGPAR